MFSKNANRDLCLATFAVAAVLSLPSAGHAAYPFVATGKVLDAADGVVATGAFWRAWTDAAPELQLRPPFSQAPIGAMRDGAFFGDVGVAGLVAHGTTLTVVVERVSADGRGYFAVVRAPISGRLAVLPESTLTAVPTPTAEGLPGGAVSVAWSPADVDGEPLLPANGVEGYVLLRALAGGVYQEVVRVPASDDLMEVLDEGLRNGRWTYAVRMIFAGDVEGEHVGGRSDTVVIGGRHGDGFDLFQALDRRRSGSGRPSFPRH